VPPTPRRSLALPLLLPLLAPMAELPRPPTPCVTPLPADPTSLAPTLPQISVLVSVLFSVLMGALLLGRVAQPMEDIMNPTEPYTVKEFYTVVRPARRAWRRSST